MVNKLSKCSIYKSSVKFKCTALSGSERWQKYSRAAPGVIFYISWSVHVRAEAEVDACVALDALNSGPEATFFLLVIFVFVNLN